MLPAPTYRRLASEPACQPLSPDGSRELIVRSLRMYPALEIVLRLDRIWTAQMPHARAFRGAFQLSSEGTNLRPSSS